MGTRVIQFALISLNNNEQWKNSNFKIASVHFLGAAIDNNEVDKNTPLGNAITNQVGQFYSLFSPKDYILLNLYPLTSIRPALGLGSAPFLSLPLNYHEQNVEDQLRPINDADGDGVHDTHDSLPVSPNIGFHDMSVGENHFGYPGFRFHSTNGWGLLRDDGAMNVVVNDWNKPSPPPPTPSPKENIVITFINATVNDLKDPSHVSNLGFTFKVSPMSAGYEVIHYPTADPQTGVQSRSGDIIKFPSNISFNVHSNPFSLMKLTIDVDDYSKPILMAPDGQPENLRMTINKIYDKSNNFGQGIHTERTTPCTSLLCKNKEFFEINYKIDVKETYN